MDLETYFTRIGIEKYRESFKAEKIVEDLKNVSN